MRDIKALSKALRKPLSALAVLGAMGVIGLCFQAIYNKSAVVRAPAGESSEGQAPRVISHPIQVAPNNDTPFRAYDFERKIAVQMGSRRLIDFALAGQLSVRKLDSLKSFEKSSEIVVRIEAPASFAGSPLVRVQVSDSLEITKLQMENLSGPKRISLATRQILGRFAVDVVQQYLFFGAQDLQGKYEAKVRRVDATHYEKLKLKYTSLPFQNAELNDSRHQLVLDSAGAVETVEGKETIAMGSGEMAFHSHSSYKIHASEIVYQDRKYPNLTWTEESIPSLESGIADNRAGPSSLEGIPPFGELMQRLQAGHLKTAEENLGLYRKIVKRLNVEEINVAVAQATLGTLKAQIPELQLLVGALATTEQLLAQTTLREVYQDPTYPPETRQLILTSWTTTDVALSNPTLELLKNLASKSDSSPSAQSALLALGAQVSKVKDPQAQADLENFIIAELHNARQVSEKTAALDAIGNSGSMRLFPYVRDYLHDPDERLRAKAYLALRKMPGETVEHLISAGNSDPSAEVRRSVQLALKLRDPA